MANEEIELFDLASRDTNACWSLNPWKTRLVLNFKNLPYKTTWLEYPAVAPTLSALNIPPNAEGVAYTIPTVRFGDGQCIMDSKPIAAALEARQPTPALHLDSPVLAQLEALMPALLAPLRGVVMPKIPRNLLNAASAEYFERTRAERFGMPLAELERAHGGEQAWADAAPHLRAVGDLLRQHQDAGPFFLGATVSYADLVVLGALRFFHRMGEGVYDRVVAIEPSLGKLYDASASLLERDTY